MGSTAADKQAKQAVKDRAGGCDSAKIASKMSFRQAR
jgi:hypothetical protein